jgi:arginine N-succinyltransferase
MAHQVRMARTNDLDALMELAALTGGGMTNFPHDRSALAEKVAWSEQSCTTQIDAPQDEFYLFVLENTATSRIVGTANIYSRIGVRWPFYSYKLSRVSHVSRGVGRHFSTYVLTLVNDFDDASEVGGLFLAPQARSGGLGHLLARSRYLFIAQHRQRFGTEIVAEMRGWQDGHTSPFWEAVGRKFFDSEFLAADLHNATQGNQFIADLMPKFPIYTALLPNDAQSAIGRPHIEAEAAKAMLEAEGFVYNGYVDIFDAGPTLHARIDQLKSIVECRHADGGLELSLSGSERYLRAEKNGLDFSVRLETD